MTQDTTTQFTTPAVVSEANVAFDHETDVVVVGGGAAAFAASVAAASEGCQVLQLEKASAVGGTTKKAAAWYWIPNNDYMRERGIKDPKDDALRYMARLSRPHLYDPADPRLGLAEWEFEALNTFYDNAHLTVRELVALGALDPLHHPEVPDYYAQLPENKAPRGRVLVPHSLDGKPGEVGSGVDMIAQFARALKKLGGEVRTDHRVEQAVLDGSGRLVGVVATTPQGPTAVRARRGVVFATGGFTHNRSMRDNYLSGPFFGGCAALSNTGDFLSIAQALGASLANMNYAWMASMPVEQALANKPGSTSTFFMAGDSMLLVNKYGRRVVNEKAPYNELAMSMHTWDPNRAEYPNLLLVMLWDAAAQARYATETFGNPITPLDGDRAHVVQARTLPELADAVAERMRSIAKKTGGFALDASFTSNLAKTVERFNALAASGVDEDFQRGESPLQQFVHGEPRPGNNTRNGTMFPLSPTGPYYATILAPTTLDTKGGPVTNGRAQVLDRTGRPIPRLYGAGNCVASPSAQAYWAGGATLGPAITFGYLAGKNVAREEPLT